MTTDNVSAKHEAIYKARLLREVKRYGAEMGIACVFQLPTPIGKFMVNVNERGEPVGEIWLEALTQ